MTQIQIRRGTRAAWIAADPILAQGEMGYEIDHHGVKVGNGSTAWNSLNYFPVQWSALNGAPAVIAAGEDKAAARASIDAAMLDQNGKVPVSQLPSSLMQYQGVWNASTNDPALVDGTGDNGDVYRVTASASRNLGAGAIDFVVGDYVIYNGTTWEKSDTTDAVATVAGRTGNVTLAVADVADAVATSDSRLSDARLPTAAGQVADISVVAFGAKSTRAVGTGDFPFGVKLQRAVTFSSVTFRVATADASGNLVVELRKNGTQVSGTPTTIAAANQVAGGTTTGTWAFAAGDILTVHISAIGTTPGKGLCCDIKGLTA